MKQKRRSPFQALRRYLLINSYLPGGDGEDSKSRTRRTQNPLGYRNTKKINSISLSQQIPTTSKAATVYTLRLCVTRVLRTLRYPRALTANLAKSRPERLQGSPLHHRRLQQQHASRLKSQKIKISPFSIANIVINWQGTPILLTGGQSRRTWQLAAPSRIPVIPNYDCKQKHQHMWTYPHCNDTMRRV